MLDRGAPLVFSLALFDFLEAIHEHSFLCRHSLAISFLRKSCTQLSLQSWKQLMVGIFASSKQVSKGPFRDLQVQFLPKKSLFVVLINRNAPLPKSYFPNFVLRSVASSSNYLSSLLYPSEA